jgi:hypothetical protein
VSRWSLVLLVIVGCDRGQPTSPEQPDTGAPVVVETPGAAPEPADEPPPSADEAPPSRTEIIATEIDCQQDSDCVKATCCHATTCVAASARPDCTSASCTADCRAGTMDCNGGCLCQAGKCAAKLWWAPSE